MHKTQNILTTVDQSVSGYFRLVNLNANQNQVQGYNIT